MRRTGIPSWFRAWPLRLGALVVVVASVASAAIVVGTSDEPRKRPPPGPGEPLTWAPPTLEDPAVWTVPASGGYFERSASEDCLVIMPRRPVTGRVQTNGCRDVVLIGGEVDVPASGLPDRSEDPAIQIEAYAGTAHIEGVEVGGQGLSEGIWASSALPGATVQVQNVLVSELHATDERAWKVEHPDVFQVWTGPTEIRFDRVTGNTPFQGATVDTANLCPGGVCHRASRIRIKRTNIRLDYRRPNGRQCFAAYRTPARRYPAKTSLYRAYCANGTQPFVSALFPRAETGCGPPDCDRRWWGAPAGDGGVRHGVPPGGDEVSAADVGVRYRSPGYAARRPSRPALTAGCRSLSADWPDVGNAESYELRSSDSRGSLTTSIEGTESSHGSHGRRREGARHVVRVRARNPQGPGPWSDAVSVTPKAC